MIRTAGICAEIMKLLISSISSDDSLAEKTHALKKMSQVFARYGGLLGKIAQILSLEVETTNVFDKCDPISSSITHEYMMGEVSEWDIYDEVLEINPEIYKAGSLGQVYKAVLHGRDQVIVKVQLLGIEDNVKEDLKILDFLVRHVYSLTQFENAILDIKEQIQCETNYLKEAEFQQIMRDLNHDDENIIIPKIHRELCTKETIVMEYMEGCESLADFIKSGTTEEKSHIGNLLLKFVFENLYKNGIYYSDNHYGNFLVKDKKTLCVLDFGSISKFDEDHVENLRKIHLSMLDEDRSLFMKTMEDIGIITDNVPEETKEFFYNKMLTHYKPFSDPCFTFDAAWIEKTSDTNVELMKELSLPRNVILLHKIPYGLYHILEKLETKVDSVKYINDTYVRK